MKKLFMFQTVSSFRHRYVIEAENELDAEEFALGIVHDRFSCNEYKEFSQKHLGEQIISQNEITMQDYLKTFDEDNDYLSTWNTHQKTRLINSVKYEPEVGEQMELDLE